MSETGLSFCLKTSSFSLEFRVLLEESEEMTKAFRREDANFVFGVVEVWLVQNEKAILIVPASNPGNFFEEIKFFLSAIKNPPTFKNLPTIIKRGCWGEWMADYWNKVDNDCLSSEDEKIYDQLIPFSVMESREGYIAIYGYESDSIIEVSSRLGSECAWSNFNEIDIGNQLEKLILSMRNALLKTLP